ncbi:MAG: TetR family transcriptional regulator [Rhodobacteraceae bacterium]|nr:MAG: TetR family transcriptional regulator [Paracoccaceae bacterium]
MDAQSTRDRIVEAADWLFYRRGFDHTSFADIADTVGISRGNFYYHFKTKDAILAAVIDLRMTNTRVMLRRWEGDGQGPKDRITCFIQILISNQVEIVRYGCPIGGLVSELAKLDHTAQDQATAIFTLFRHWLRAQFAQMGRAGDADTLAMHLLARSQGVATLASAFHDAEFIQAEVGHMCDWVQALEPPTNRNSR